MLALYHNDMSLCAQKVRVCLAEKGLAWEDRHLVLRAGEHQQPWYLKLNRRAVVPTLIDGDKPATITPSRTWRSRPTLRGSNISMSSP